ncbi:MAG: hypothetical protein H0W97_05950, partial [Actinobacteria bacterium]|nr:hypothetical protein [Actinomycetota bacterium]
MSTQTSMAQEAAGDPSAAAPSAPAPPEGLFGRGLRLIVSYVRMHPGPFFVSVTGAIVFAFAS